jgi:hypothetical protein
MDNIKKIAERWMVKGLKVARVNYGMYGVQENIDDWFMGKQKLIEMFRKSPNWSEENLAIIKTIEYARQISSLTKRNNFSNLMFAVKQAMRLHSQTKYIDMIQIMGYAMDNDTGYDTSRIFVSERLTEQDVLFIKEALGYSRVQEGMKTSRLVQKIFQQWAPLSMENKVVQDAYYAWTESLSESKVKAKHVISLNPADYLLMSWGNSWASCHIINPEIADGDTHSGCFRAGTLSYMGDSSSVLCYTVKPEVEDDDCPITPKVSREISFMTDEQPVFYQSRMYPSNGDDKLKEVYRKSIQEELNAIFNIENPEWELDNDRNCRFVTHSNLHYKDYDHYGYHYREKGMGVHFQRYDAGNYASCLECGETGIEEPNTLYCDSCRGDAYYCARCGDFVHEDDVFYLDEYDDYYCRDCTITCAQCGTVCTVDDMVTTARDEYVCPDCFENNYFECWVCGSIDHMDYGYLVNDDYYCEDCFHEGFTFCDYCSEPVSLADAVEHDGYKYCPDCAPELEDDEETVAETEEVPVA